MPHEGDPVAQAGLVDLIGGSLEGPVDEHGPADDILTRDKSPEPTVERLGAIVAHREDSARRDNQIAIVDMTGQIHGPQRGVVVAGGLLDAGQVRGEIVAVRGIGIFGVAIVSGHRGVGLVLGDSVQVHDAVLKVDAVAREPDAALHQVEVGGFGVRLQKDDDIAAARLAVADEGRPLRGGRERDAVDQHVVADQQRLLHRRRRDLEVLENKGHDEEADRQDGADRGERLECSLVVLVFGRGSGGRGFFVGGGGCCVRQIGVSALHLMCRR